MNKKITLAKIKAIANELDNNGLFSHADSLTKVMVKIAARGDRASVQMQSDGTPAILITRYNGKFEKRLYYKTQDGKSAYFRNLQHALNYARRIDPNAEVINPMPTRDDQGMFDFEASREDKH